MIQGCSHQTIGPVIMDFDGNKYLTVNLGSQQWMSENLRATHYQNGDPLELVSDHSLWPNLKSGAYCDYNNDSSEIDKFGRLYNWYIIMDEHEICPVGWHVPTDSDWLQLEEFLGDKKTAGGKLKESGTENWKAPNLKATNEYRFGALPAGFRHQSGNYYLKGKNACFWTSTETDSTSAWYRDLDSDDAEIGKLNNFKSSGLSIRCVRD